MMDSDDGGPFSLTQSLTEGGGYAGNSTSIANQYHVWAAAATSTSLSNNNSTTTLPTHFSPVSPTGHGLYNDHLTLHPSQTTVDTLSMRLGQGDYHSSATERLSQGDGYHTAVGTESSSRHPGNQSDYHNHLVNQDRHLGLESYHHISASSSASSSAPQQQDRLASSEYHTSQTAERLTQNDYHSAQQSSRLSRSDYHTAQPSDRLGQNDYHATQQSDRLAQNDYHSGQQSDRLGQTEYHVATQSDRLGQLDYSNSQGERLQGGLTKQDYHALGSEQLGQHGASYHSGQGGQQASTFHPGQTADRSLAAQADYHSAQVDLDAVNMHTDFDRRHLDVSLLSKDLVDSGQRGSAMDYLTSQNSRDSLAGLHHDIVGLQREMDLSVGQTISMPQRSAPADLASTSYSLDPATLPRDLSPYSQRDLDRAVLSASEVVAGQVGDGTGHGSTGGLHPQDLAGINLTAASRDLVDLTTLARSSTGRDDMGRVRDVIHRPRNEIPRALELEVLGSLDSSSASVDLTLNGGSSTKLSSRTYPSTSRLTSSTKRQMVATSQPADVRLQNPLSAVSATSSGGAGMNFFPLPTSRDTLNIMAMADPSAAGASSRHNTSDFARQQPTEMSRLRRELTAPYPDLGVHHSMLATAAPLPVPAFKSSVEPIFSTHGDLICNDTLTSSRERLYEMMKQQQFCDAVLGTSLHSIKVHKAVLCSASAYLCGVLSQTCIGKSGGRILTVQFKADIPASSLSAFIDYIYQGRMKLVAKSMRDLNIMARCLHMESLKKTSEEMLVSMGVTNDADIAIPELILLETLVDKLDKECTASFPVPVPAPPSCHVAVETDPTFFPSTTVEQSCQTDQVPSPADCACASGAMDLRSGGGSLRLGGLGTLSLATNGGAGGDRDHENPAAPAESKVEVSDSVGLSFSAVKSHHKKHLVSQARQVKSESVSPMPLLPVSSSSLSPTSVSSTVVTPITSSVTVTTTTDPMQKLSIDTEMVGQSAAHRSATPNPHPVSKLPSKARKRTSMPTSTLSPSLPSSQVVLPGQTARPVLHSYGTRAATRTPTKHLDLACPQPGSGSTKQTLGPRGSGGAAETQGVKDSSEDCSSEAQIQMAKHRGRTKKGRIAAALSEALKQSSQIEGASALSDQKPGNVGKDGKQVSSGAKLGSDAVPVPSSVGSDTSLVPTVTLATTTTTTTTLTEAKRSAPRAYRKRLIQSVVSDQLLMAKTETPEEDAKVKDTEGNKAGSEKMKVERAADSNVPESKGMEEAGTITTEQLRDTLHSPVTTKRKKKGKARRMLLSSPSSSGGVRVRAPPKKRAKMELELEQMMREEMEEEEEEEELAAAANAALKMEQRDGVEAGSGPQCYGQQPPPGSIVRIKMPSMKPGKKPRWIKKDQMAHLMIELNQKASSVTDGSCVFVCLLCNNRFLLPRRCLSHVMVTHKVQEAEVMEQIEVRQQEEEEKCADDGGAISHDLVCDICGYRSRENTTYYLHYHKYFKHGVPLPKGWSVYSCDLCGKELFTKFQLKDHKRTHLEKTPFVCEICGSGFQSRSNLHSHVFHRHRAEKKHSCDKCDRTFKTRTQLSVHCRTHTGARPFSCPECPYHSTTRGNMRLHLINRHKMSNGDASDIMRDIKPDFDISLRSVTQQTSSDSGGEKKSPGKRKSGGNTKSKLKKEKEELEMQQTSASTSSLGNQSGVTESVAMELLLKNSGGDCLASNKDGAEAGKVKDTAGGQQELSVLGSSVVLTGEGEGNMVTLQAADPFPSAGGVGMCGETGAVFLPQGLETMFQQQGNDLAMTSTVSSTAATTILVPENFLLHHQPQTLQPSHKHLYPQGHSHFTSFVVGTAPTLQTLTPSDLIVSATALNAEGLKAEEVVDLGDMSMGAMEVDNTFRQGALNTSDLNLQASTNPAPQPTELSSPSTSQENNVQLYMQHSPISPAPPISPTPVYVAVTPTPQPLAVVKQEGQDVATPTVAVSAAGSGVLVDQLQHGQALQQYDANLLQAYYAAGQLYSHNC